MLGWDLMELNFGSFAMQNLNISMDIVQRENEKNGGHLSSYYV